MAKIKKWKSSETTWATCVIPFVNVLWDGESHFCSYMTRKDYHCGQRIKGRHRGEIKTGTIMTSPFEYNVSVFPNLPIGCMKFLEHQEVE